MWETMDKREKDLGGADLESEWKKRTGGDFPPVPQMLFNHGDGYL